MEKELKKMCKQMIDHMDYKVKTIKNKEDNKIKGIYQVIENARNTCEL